MIIDHIVIDSRRYTEAEGALFFAIRGSQNDGHRFIPELYEKGIKCFVIEDLPDRRKYPGAAFIVVNDTIVSLQALAAHLRNEFKGEVLAITGSNGKTIVKEWIYQALNPLIPAVRSPMSYNSQVGVPLSLFLLENRYDLAIIEAGISRSGEMEKLESMIKPDTGIFTNIGGHTRKILPR